MQITGILKEKFETKTVSDKFKKREFVVTIDGTTPYPQHISCQLTQDKVDLINTVNIGDEVEVHFNLRGREWNGPQGVKYFNTIEAWRIVKLQDAPAEQEPKLMTPPSNNDDLPF